MRALIQRVSSASVFIDSLEHSSINSGLVLLIGVQTGDTKEDADYLLKKILNVRIFSDKEGKMNLSVLDIAGEMLIVSQFTLYASTKKGNRPSFIKSARPEEAIPLYEYFVKTCSNAIKVKTGKFGADMQVSLINNGPVTVWLDSRNRE